MATMQKSASNNVVLQTIKVWGVTNEGQTSYAGPIWPVRAWLTENYTRLCSARGRQLDNQPRRVAKHPERSGAEPASATRSEMAPRPSDDPPHGQNGFPRIAVPL